MLRYGLYETLDRDHFYPTLMAAVREVEAIGPLSAVEETSGRGRRRH